MCDVVGASIVHKIVKIDYIALQCKSLIILTIIHCIKVAINGCDWVMESAHRRDYDAG